MTRLRNERAGLFMSYRMAMGGAAKVGDPIPPIITTKTEIPVTIVMQRFRWAHTIEQAVSPMAVEP
jgi:hypothetical protein